MTQPIAHPALVILGGSSSFIYLIRRYAERLGYSIVTMPVSAAMDEVCNVRPVAAIFPSLESMENAQPLVLELTNCDIPLVACSSVMDQLRSRKLGADYCLLHPFVYDNFSAILATITSQNIRQDNGGGQV